MFDHLRHIVSGDELVQRILPPPLVMRLLVFFFELDALHFAIGGAFIIARQAGRLLFQRQLIDGFAHALEGLRHGKQGDAQLGRRFVEEVNRLIGQFALGQITGGEAGGRFDGVIGDVDVVMRFVTIAYAIEHLDGVLNIGLFDEDRGKASVEGAVLFDLLAVFIHGGGADRLQFAARQSRFHHVAGIHCAGGRARADHLVQLVNEKDDLAFGTLNLFDGAFEAFFKFATETAAGQHPAQIQAEHTLAQKDIRHIVGGDLLRQAFDDGGLADAGFANQNRIVLGAAAEHLNHAQDFAVAPDDRIELAFLRHAR